jgi:hypothetical protein
VLHPKKGHKKKINVCATIEKMVKRKKGWNLANSSAFASWFRVFCGISPFYLNIVMEILHLGGKEGTRRKIRKNIISHTMTYVHWNFNKRGIKKSAPV